MLVEVGLQRVLLVVGLAEGAAAVRSQRPISQSSAAKRGLAVFRRCANGRRPEYSSPQAAQPTEKDMSDACVRTPSSASRRTRSG